MTVIAYKDGVVCSDSQATYSDGRKENCRKLYRVKDTIIGTSGDSYTGLIFVDWFERGARMEDCPDLSMVELEEDFECLVIEDTENIYTINRFFQKHPIEMYKHYAVGCGAGYAMIAMDLGCSAREAVKKTCEYDSYCGGKIQVMKARNGGEKPKNRPPLKSKKAKTK